MNIPQTRQILSDLVAFDTTSRKSNLELLDYVEAYLAPFGISGKRIYNEEGTKANFWATIGEPGPGGIVLSGHTDCVPVENQNWSSDPFTLTEREGRLYGRGSADMKGFVASVLANVPFILAQSKSRPVHLAFSYDEEIGCVGVRSLLTHLATQEHRPSMCIVGEPTSMQVVTGHKGGRAYRCTFEGFSVHSSLAPIGVNAIEFAAELIVFIRSVARKLADGPQDADFDVAHSTISAGLIEGGSAINIVPNHCSFVFEFRNLLEVDQDAIFENLRNYAVSKLLPEMRKNFPQADIRFEQLYEYPAHAIEADHPLVTLTKAIAGRNDQSKVAFGAEAGLFLRELGIPTILCGPGSISVAHQPDEYVDQSQLDACDMFIRKLCAK